MPYMPPLQLPDLPPNPPPYDGKSKLLVLAYPMSDNHKLWWARKYNNHHLLNSESCTPYERMGSAVLKMSLLLPEECKMTMIRFKNGKVSAAWMITTNKEKDLPLASNLELINKVKKVIRIQGPPRWYEYEY